MPAILLISYHGITFYQSSYSPNSLSSLKKTAAKSLARGFLKHNLLIYLINF